MLADLRALRDDIQLTVVSGDPEQTARSHGVGVIPRRDPLAFEEAVRNADLVLIGGGGLFQDYWGLNPDAILVDRDLGLCFYSTPAVLAALHHKPLMLYAVGVGPLQSQLGRQFTKAVAEAATIITVRDAGSKADLESLGIPGSKVILTADPAFLLEVQSPSRGEETATSLGFTGARPLVGVSVRHWDKGVLPEYWEREVALALDMFLESEGGTVAFVPFQTMSTAWENDSAVAERVRSRMKRVDQTLVFRDEPSGPEIAGLLSACDLVLGMRLHAGIFAVLGGVPLVALSYDPKVTRLMQEIGFSQFAVDLGGIEARKLVDSMRQALDQRPLYAPALRKIGDELRRRAKRNAEIAVDLLSRRAAKRVFTPDLLFLLGRTLRSQLLAAHGLRHDLLLQKGTAESLTAEIAMRQQEVARLSGEVTKLSEELERALRVAQEQSQFRESLEETLRATREELGRREEDVRQARREGQHALDRAREDFQYQKEVGERQRRTLLSERNELGRELKTFKGSAGVRLLLRYRELLQRFLPEGSRRRAAYWKLHQALRSQLGLAPPAMSSGAGAATMTPEAGTATIASGAGASVSVPDPRGELSRFVELVTGRRAKSLAAVLSATKLLESEGQRPTQLALEFSRRGIPVVFSYWRWWPDEWCPQDRLGQGIFQIPIDVVVENPDDLFGAFDGAERLAFFEFPHPSFFEPLAAANANGWITVYDVLDDWEEFHRVGQAVWYQEPFERHLIRAADAVFAINEPLAERIRSLGGENVEIVPNGLKPGIEKIDRPRRLERGEVTVGYFGYLAGAWFDWKLVASAARARPSWRFYLIGYGGSPEGVVLPENVTMLGKKPQTELASYAANWDAAVIPFKPDRLAAGADPIKTYEYLVMGLPVVVTGVYPPPGGEEFVRRAEGLEEFLAKLARASGEKSRRAAERRAYAASCAWPRRVDALMESVRSGRQRVAEKQRLFAG